jgi:hypothetical protein
VHGSHDAKFYEAMNEIEEQHVGYLAKGVIPCTIPNAFEWLAKRKDANSTNKFKSASIAFNPFLFIALIDAQ